MKKRFLVLLLALLAAGAPAEEMTTAALAGRPLTEVLTELQHRGQRIIFSTALVRPEMVVEPLPAATSHADDPHRLLEGLLAPHGLAVRSGPDGALLVIPGRLPRHSRSPSRLRGRVIDRGSRLAIGGAEIYVTGSEHRAVTDDEGRFTVSPPLIPPRGTVSPWGDLRGEKTVSPETVSPETVSPETVSDRADGVYRLEARKAGFAAAALDVRLGPGHTSEVLLELLALPTTLDEIEVLPALEVGSIQSGTILRRDELERVPTPRDPWSVVHHTPGVLTDRVNVGGSTSGTQAVFLAPGSSSEENIFELDGVNTTDMVVLGASSLYYDFDQFEEMQISTGGADVRTATAGVSVRMTTKSGTDVLKGSLRYLWTDADGVLGQGLFTQGSSDVSSKLGPGQGEIFGNDADRILDYGFELGGPLIDDKLWGWASYGVNDIDIFAVGLIAGERGVPDDTYLVSTAFKLTSQLGPSSSLVASMHKSDKRKEHRGASPGRAEETTWRQRGPSHTWKLEDTHLWAPRFFTTAQYHYVDSSFSLIPRAGLGAEARLDSSGVWRDGYWGGVNDRDSESWQLEATRLVGRGFVHTLELGGSLRQFREGDENGWAGPRQAYNVACENRGLCGLGDLIFFERVGEPRAHVDYQTLWVQDSLNAGRWTWKLGLRFDAQEGRNLPGFATANPIVPEVLPAVSFAGGGGGFDFVSLAPRFSASYGLRRDGRTLLRLSLGRFSEQLGALEIQRLNPLSNTEAAFSFADENGDGIWQEGESRELFSTIGIDPGAPLVSSNRNDPGLGPELTDELLVGVEHSLRSRWIAGLNLTLRRVSDIAELRPLITDADVVRPATAADYLFDGSVTVTDPAGNPATADFFALAPHLRWTGGEWLTNGDRERDYLGLTMSFVRLFTNRWSWRGHLTWGRATWDVPSSFQDEHDPSDLVGGGDNDGALFAPRGGRDVYLQSTWSGQMSGFYQVAPERPWGFTVAASVLARQGYPIPYQVSIISGRDGLRRDVQVTRDIDSFRTDDIFTLDLSLEKDLRLKRWNVTLSLSAFNLLNSRAVVQRARQLNSARADHLEETLAPRIVRFGIRLRR